MTDSGIGLRSESAPSAMRVVVRRPKVVQPLSQWPATANVRFWPSVVFRHCPQLGASVSFFVPIDRRGSARSTHSPKDGEQRKGLNRMELTYEPSIHSRIRISSASMRKRLRERGSCLAIHVESTNQQSAHFSRRGNIDTQYLTVRSPDFGRRGYSLAKL